MSENDPCCDGRWLQCRCQHFKGRLIAVTDPIKRANIHTNINHWRNQLQQLYYFDISLQLEVQIKTLLELRFQKSGLWSLKTEQGTIKGANQKFTHHLKWSGTRKKYGINIILSGLYANKDRAKIE